MVTSKTMSDAAQELYEIVDAPMMECKKAMHACNGDLEAAVEYLCVPHQHGTTAQGRFRAFKLRELNE